MAAAEHDVSYARECVVGGSWRQLLYLHVEKIISKKIEGKQDIILLTKYEDIMDKIANSKMMTKKDLVSRFAALSEGIAVFHDSFCQVADDFYDGWERELVEEIKGLLFANYAYLSKTFTIGRIVVERPGVYKVQETGLHEKGVLKNFHQKLDEFLTSNMKKGITKDEIAQEIRSLLDIAKELCLMNFSQGTSNH